MEAHLISNINGKILADEVIIGQPAGRKYGRACGDMKVTNDISDRILRLPMYYDINDDIVERVMDAVKLFYCR